MEADHDNEYALAYARAKRSLVELAEVWPESPPSDVRAENALDRLHEFIAPAVELAIVQRLLARVEAEPESAAKGLLLKVLRDW
jgi:hypothetical protein